MKLFVHPWILNIFSLFLKFDTRMVSDFLYVIKYKKRNIKLNFDKDKFNLLNMRRKINKTGKYKIIHTVWKIF